MDAISSAIDAASKAQPAMECRLGEPLRNHTSFKIGGPVRAMFFPESAEELIALCETLHKSGVRPFIMGNGTNLLAGDNAMDMVVIKTTDMGSIELTGETEITALCGAPLSKLAVFACERGLSGLEFAHGIPGTLGGAVLMNAGAYGGEMGGVVYKTQAFNADRGVFTVTGKEHGFEYRCSRFSDSGDIILSSVIRLQKGDAADIRAKIDEYNARRRQSQPLNLPSAGSAFKRPRGAYAAALIEEAGLKGFVVGGAAVSEKHSGFIVNLGGAAFDDVMAVIDHVRETVFSQTGIELETEIKIIRGYESWK